MNIEVTASILGNYTNPKYVREILTTRRFNGAPASQTLIDAAASALRNWKQYRQAAGRNYGRELSQYAGERKFS